MDGEATGRVVPPVLSRIGRSVPRARPDPARLLRTLPQGHLRAPGRNTGGYRGIRVSSKAGSGAATAGWHTPCTSPFPGVVRPPHRFQLLPHGSCDERSSQREQEHDHVRDPFRSTPGSSFLSIPPPGMGTATRPPESLRRIEPPQGGGSAFHRIEPTSCDSRMRAGWRVAHVVRFGWIGHRHGSGSAQPEGELDRVGGGARRRTGGALPGPGQDA